ncbi:2-dehydro-3-deoxygalactonokinase [Aestuariispira ectoiniformans]|uniref:2-dehydro-3-deoxygalactonokinase n=1 Tax=Aestuariispira ectoiniformans TaxID=2775080 RepID=UPI00223B70B4|nr:2-dehydro-3-deoxygalactonokinase [Aestuariispira ectoiniformans]
MDHSAPTNWVAVDWGTSNLRAWLIGDDNTNIEQRSSDQGMGRLEPGDFEPVLLSMLSGWLPADGVLPVLICGMAGARQGWAEAPYLTVPCSPPTAAGAITPPTKDPRLRVRILPGLCQTEPADVIRGEETQLAGLLAQAPTFEGVVCLPGTHTKWVQITGGTISTFRTFMTGELFGLLARQSVLRHTVTDCGWDNKAFAATLIDSIAPPQTLTTRLFSLRAKDLLEGLDAAVARAQLSGMLIGTELAALDPLWLLDEVVIIGDLKLSALYNEALALTGISARLLDAEAMTLAGLKTAYKRIGEPVL